MYSLKVNEDDYIVGKARIEEVDASFKDLGAVCDNIRYKKVIDAIELLEKASRGEVPLRYYKHNKKLAHRKELQGKKGRYPKKAAKIVLDLLKSAKANAMLKGASEEELIVKHAAANKKRIYYRIQPKGRRLRHDYELSRVEIIVMQRKSEEMKKQEEAKEVKKAQAKTKAKGKEASEKEEVKKSVKKSAKKEEVQKEQKEAQETKKKEGVKGAKKPSSKKTTKKASSSSPEAKKTEKQKEGDS